MRLTSKELSLEIKIIKRLLKIKDLLDLSNATFCEFANTSASQMMKIRRGEKYLTVNQIHSICSAFDLSINRLFDGKIDYLALAKQYHGDTLALPERYSSDEFKLARIRSIRSIFEFLHQHFGYDYAHSIFRRFQIKPIFTAQDLNTFISPKIFLDLLHELKQAGLSDAHFIEAGVQSFVVNSYTPFGNDLSKIKSPGQLYKSLYEKMFDHHYDHIFHYKLVKLDLTGCTYEIYPRKNSLEMYKTKTIGNRTTCLFKQGVGISFLRHIKNYTAKISESACMYQGDDRCIYHVHWV